MCPQPLSTAVFAHDLRGGPAEAVAQVRYARASSDHWRDAGLAPLEAVHDRVLLRHKGFVEGNHGEPGQFVVEKAFMER
ncbi:MAG: ferredoxin/flavodoxin---NADP+ reductase [Hyphomicrobiales bacterium]